MVNNYSRTLADLMALQLFTLSKLNALVHNCDLPKESAEFLRSRFIGKNTIAQETQFYFKRNNKFDLWMDG